MPKIRCNQAVFQSKALQAEGATTKREAKKVAKNNEISNQGSRKH